MKKMLWLAAAAMNASTPAGAAALSDAIRADMPQLMTLIATFTRTPSFRCRRFVRRPRSRPRFAS